jgi:hypothetical protein
MKKSILVLLVAVMTLPGYSQLLKFGIKAGVSTNSISMGQAVSLVGQSGTYTVEALKNAQFGYHAGFFLRVKLLGIYVQPEVLFTSVENKYNVTNPGSSNPVETLQSLKNLSIPVMVGFKLGPIRINAGPAASYTLNKPAELINDVNLSSLLNKFTFGYQAGVGFDLFKKLTFDARYEGSLSKYKTQIENLTGGTKVSLDNRPNAFIFSLGLMF